MHGGTEDPCDSTCGHTYQNNSLINCPRIHCVSSKRPCLQPGKHQLELDNGRPFSFPTHPFLTSLFRFPVSITKVRRMVGASLREGNGTPLQYSCLENPMDGGAWWSPWGRQGSDMTERLHFHFSLSCIGEGNGNPLQCSCLENPRDGGTWWAAVHGVSQSRTRLK